MDVFVWSFGTCTSVRTLPRDDEHLLCEDIPYMDLDINEKYKFYDEDDTESADGFYTTTECVRNVERDQKYNSKDRCYILIYGITKAGIPVTIRVKYRPWLFVEIPVYWGTSELRRFIQDIAESCYQPVQEITFEEQLRKRTNGWVPVQDGSATKEFRCLKLYFPSVGAMTFSRRNLTKQNLKFWESRVTPIQKFCDDQSIKPCSWIRITSNICKQTQERMTHSKFEYDVSDSTKVLPIDGKDDIPPIKIASIDIECYSASGNFPSPYNENDAVIGIGTSVQCFGKPEIKRYYHALMDTKIDPSDNPNNLDIQVFWYHTEGDLLLAWRDFLVSTINPDFVTGYNIFGFDWRYLASRAQQKLGLSSRFFYLGRLWGKYTPLERVGFESKAYGQMDMYQFQMDGRVTVDLLRTITKEHNLSDYRLDAVSKHFLKREKVDLSPQELFRLYPIGPHERGKIAVYCSMDCDLPLHLLNRLQWIINNVEMCRVTVTPLVDIVNRGQQIKVYNQLLWEGHRYGFMLNDVEKAHGTYEGATVIDPTSGFYKDPVVVLDFASLYPSIMIDQNLCHSTIVNNPSFMNLPEAKYHTRKIGSHTYTFITHIEGVLPRILRKLLTARKNVKAMMKQYSKDDVMYGILNGRQLAIKVSCNSVYGFCGATERGVYPCKAVSEWTTARGREMLQITWNSIETKFREEGLQVEVVYGDTDSVMILVKGATVQSAWEFGVKAAKFSTSLFGEAVKLELEKIFYPFMISDKKKRYVGMKYDGPNEEPYPAYKGLESVRRDGWPFARHTQKKMIDTLLTSMSPEEGIKVVIDRMKMIALDQIPFEEFVLSKSLKKTYANPDSVVQVAVRNQIRNRAPGSEPQPGDRVQYVIVETQNPKAKLAEHVEDADYAKQNNMRLDYVYYLQCPLKGLL